MKRAILIAFCVLALSCLGGAAWAQQGNQQGGTYYGPGYGGYGPYGQMGPGMMGPGYGYGMMGPGYGPYGQMGPGMMGPGYGYGRGGGYGMMGRGGYGMMGPGYGYGMRGGYGQMGPRAYGPGLAPPYQGWQNMSPKDQQAWREMYRKFLKDTLKLRQKLITKQMELQALWSEPKPDQDKVNDLAKEVGELRSQLAAKQNKFLTGCRSRFGDKGWACPGAGY